MQFTWLFGVALGIALTSPPQDQPPRIFLDLPPRAVEYQLSRLTNEELVRVVRRDDDMRYRPMYAALLTRKGLAREFRDEAVAALAKLDRTTPARVLLDTLSKLPADDSVTADKLLAMVYAQSAEVLRQHRDDFTKAIEGSSPPFVLRAAYGGLMIAEGNPEGAWPIAAKREGHLLELLRGVPVLPASASAQLFSHISSLLTDGRDPRMRAEALTALGWIRRDAATFDVLANEVVGAPAGSDPTTRLAAIHALTLFPDNAWSKPAIEPLARAIVALVKNAPPAQRTEPALVEAMQFVERLTAGLADDFRLPIRRDLRAIGVQAVRIATVPEQMAYDLRWFVVEAGKPVQIVLYNADVMPHNLLITKPGSLREIGMAAATMTLPSNPDVKPYVPNSPLVLQSFRLLNEGETDKLSFQAPNEPGEYVYLCTYPGHWVRMYGVMLVVDSLESWEVKPTVPIDPVTNQPFSSRRTGG